MTLEEAKQFMRERSNTLKWEKVIEGINDNDPNRCFAVLLESKPTSYTDEDIAKMSEADRKWHEAFWVIHKSKNLQNEQEKQSLKKS